jgi:hypothetical protein
LNSGPQSRSPHPRNSSAAPDANTEHVQKLVEKLDQTFENFSTVEQTLWKQVQP